MQTEAGRKPPVERRRRAAPLDMAEHGRAGLPPGPATDLSLQHGRDSLQPDMPEGVQLPFLDHQAAGHRTRSLSHHDDRRVVRGEAVFDEGTDLVDVEGSFRNEDHVGARRHSAVQGDPTGMPAHDLDDEDAMMAFGGGVQAVDGLHRDVDRRVEPEGVVGGRQVVVDGFGNPDNRDSFGVEPGGDAEGVLAPDGDEGVDPQVVNSFPDAGDAVVHLVGVCATGTENRPTARKNAADRVDAERHRSIFQGTTPAVPKTYERMSIDIYSFTDDRPYDRIQPWAVPAACQHADPHDRTSSSPPGRPVSGSSERSVVAAKRCRNTSDSVARPEAPRKPTPRLPATALPAAVPAPASGPGCGERRQARRERRAVAGAVLDGRPPPRAGAGRG